MSVLTLTACRDAGYLFISRNSWFGLKIASKIPCAIFDLEGDDVRDWIVKLFYRFNESHIV